MHAPRDLDTNDLGSHTPLMLRAEAWEGSCYCELLFFLAFSYPFPFLAQHTTTHYLVGCAANIWPYTHVCVASLPCRAAIPGMRSSESNCKNIYFYIISPTSSSSFLMEYSASLRCKPLYCRRWLFDMHGTLFCLASFEFDSPSWS